MLTNIPHEQHPPTSDWAWLVAQSIMAGTLPAEWGDSEAWTTLQLLDLSYNNLTGGSQVVITSSKEPA